VKNRVGQDVSRIDINDPEYVHVDDAQLEDHDAEDD